MTKNISKCGKYNKVRQILQSVTGITKCDKKLLQSVTGIKKCGSYYGHMIEV